MYVVDAEILVLVYEDTLYRVEVERVPVLTEKSFNSCGTIGEFSFHDLLLIDFRKKIYILIDKFSPILRIGEVSLKNR